MFLLVPAHPGCPGQIPQSRKTVVCVCVCVDNPVNLTSDLLNLGLMHAKGYEVLITPAIFLLECRQTDTQTDTLSYRCN